MFDLLECFSNLSMNHSEGLVRHTLLGPSPRVSEPVGLRRYLDSLHCNSFPADDDVAALGLHSENHGLRLTKSLCYVEV
jgi:hypothetical protein